MRVRCADEVVEECSQQNPHTEEHHTAHHEMIQILNSVSLQESTKLIIKKNNQPRFNIFNKQCDNSGLHLIHELIKHCLTGSNSEIVQ